MLKNMKNKIYALALSLLMLMVACGKDDATEGGNLGRDIAKDWKLVSVNGVEPEFTVYLRFDSGIFNIFQQLYTWDYLFYDGTYSVKGGVVSGSYFDGTSWKCSYKGLLSNNGKRLKLVSKEKNPITNIYEECVIPQSVIDEVSTRSGVEGVYHL